LHPIPTGRDIRYTATMSQNPPSLRPDLANARVPRDAAQATVTAPKRENQAAPRRW